MRRFLGAGAWLFAGIMASRILGLIRDILVSRFGASTTADIAIVAITVPDTMINILIGGAMGAALIPEFKRRSQSEGFRLYIQSTMLAAGAALVVALGLMLGAESLTRLLLQKLPPDQLPFAASLVRISLWAVPITAMSAVARARLQSEEKFAVPSLAGFFYNLAILSGLVAAITMKTLWPIASAAIAGALLSFAMQVAALIRSPRSDPADPPVPTGWLIDGGLIRRYGGALGAGAMILVLPLIVRSLASRYGEGAQSIAYLAAKLVELPMGTLLSVVSIAMFPAIAETLASPNRRAEAENLVRQGIDAIVALALPVALGIGLFAHDYAALLFGHGEMTEPQVRMIALMGAIMLGGLVFQAMNTMMLSVYNGLRDMRTPFLISSAILAAFLVAGWLSPGLVELAVGVAVFHALLWVGLTVGLARRHGISVSRGILNTRSLRRILATGTGFFATALPLYLWVPGVVPRVASSILAGAFAFAAAMAVDPGIRNRLTSAVSNKLRRRA